MKEIIVELKAKHFIGTDYISYCGRCAVEKALDEVMPDIETIELIDETLIGRIIYKHEEYDELSFMRDQEFAQDKELNHVIRVLTLTETSESR